MGEEEFWGSGWVYEGGYMIGVVCVCVVYVMVYRRSLCMGLDWSWWIWMYDGVGDCCVLNDVGFCVWERDGMRAET